MDLSKFSDRAMSKSQLKNVKGGVWCYAYSCTCGSVSYNGWGTLDDYRGDASANCSPGVGVSCNFAQLAPATCGG
jgi:natural product precursor